MTARSACCASLPAAAWQSVAARAAVAAVAAATLADAPIAARTAVGSCPAAAAIPADTADRSVHIRIGLAPFTAATTRRADTTVSAKPSVAANRILQFGRGKATSAAYASTLIRNTVGTRAAGSRVRPVPPGRNYVEARSTGRGESIDWEVVVTCQAASPRTTRAACAAVADQVGPAAVATNTGRRDPVPGRAFPTGTTAAEPPPAGAAAAPSLSR